MQQQMSEPRGACNMQGGHHPEKFSAFGMPVETESVPTGSDAYTHVTTLHQN